MLTMQVKIAQLDRNGLQTRCALDERTVAEYAEAMADGAEFPPVVVFSMPTGRKHFWLADGFHRVEAALRNGQDELWCDLRKGGFVDALRYALSCNAQHGKRVTNEDKQNALRMAWDNRVQLFGADPSAALLAKTCGVAVRTAQSYISDNLPPPAPMPKRPAKGKRQPMQIAEVVPPTRQVVGTDGKVRAMPVRPAAPAVAPAAPVRPAKSAQPMPKRPAKKHVVPVDRYGTEIPVAINAAFEGGVLADICRLISKARVALRKGMEDKLPMFAAVRQDALVQLDNAYRFVSAAEPHCVCRICQGQGCKACHGRGWQTEEEYGRNPKEFKVQ